MLNIRRPILGTDDSISNVVKIAILKELSGYIDVDSDRVGVIYEQGISGIIHDNWNIKGDSKDVELKETILRVSSSEETTEETGYLSPVDNNAPMIFMDESLIIRPVYLQTKMIISVEISSKSKSYVMSIRDKVKLSFLDSSDVKTHDVEYRYSLPMISNILIGIYYQHKKEYKLEDSFTKYVIGNSGGRLSLASTQGGKDHMLSLVAVETQSNIVGRFTLDLNKEVSHDNGEYKLDLEYEVTYSKPTYMDSRYDIAFANQSLPSELITTSLDDIGELEPYTGDAFHFLRREQWFILKLLHLQKHDYIRIPKVDNHASFSRTQDEKILFSVLTEVTPDDRFSLFNLRNLIDIELTPNALLYIEDNYQYLTQPLEAIFTLYIYDSNNERRDLKIRVDSELNVYTDVDLNLNISHRVFFVLNSNWRLLTQGAKNRLNKFILKTGGIKSIILPVNTNRFENVIGEFSNSDSSLFGFNLYQKGHINEYSLLTFTEMLDSYLNVNNVELADVLLLVNSTNRWGILKEYSVIKGDNTVQLVKSLSGTISAIDIANVLEQYTIANNDTLIYVLDIYAKDNFTMLDVLLKYTRVKGGNINDIFKDYANTNVDFNINDMLTNIEDALTITIFGEKNKPWLFLDTSFDVIENTSVFVKTVQTAMTNAYIINKKG